MRRTVALAATWMAQGFIAFGVEPNGHLRPPLDQITSEFKTQLRIDRFVGLGEEGLQAEYEWALEMAVLCLEAPDFLRRKGYEDMAIEFQRHAGRTARYRGFLEQAIADYELAVDYAHETVGIVGALLPDDSPAVYEELIFRDIADVYVLMGAHEPAELISEIIIDRTLLRGDPERRSPPELIRLTQIAQTQADHKSAVSLIQEIVRAHRGHVQVYLDRHPELSHIDASLPWSKVVRHPGVQAALVIADAEDKAWTNLLKEDACMLARALRLDGKLEAAAFALETAELTPWIPISTYRAKLDFCVDRERAFLALARGDQQTTLQAATKCLAGYPLTHAERVELLDLLSRAKEASGDLAGALEQLEAAIAIVESDRANLREDESKQLFVAGFAPLYRRALELTIKIYGKNKAKQLERSFEWSERVKGRAMLDTFDRLDRRMALAQDSGEATKMRELRTQARRVVSLRDLQSAPWLADGTAFIEYTFGPSSARDGSGRLYAWTVTKKRATFHEISVTRENIDRRCAELAQSLRAGTVDRNEWVDPASWLYERILAPLHDYLQNAKRLVVIADGSLWAVPFEVLVRARNRHPKRAINHHLLIEDFSVAYTPSATFLDRIKHGPRAESWGQSLWAFASSSFIDRDDESATQDQTPVDTLRGVLRSSRELNLPPLPHAAAEVKEVAAILNDASAATSVDEPNMKDAILSASDAGSLRTIRFLHFATHAITDPARPNLSGLVMCPPYASIAEPAPSEEAKKRNQLKLTRSVGDANRPELLTVREITKMDVGSELVVLSACRTLGGLMIEGDWLTGLTRAFLVAGASGVVSTTWETPDRSALTVVPAFYRSLLSQTEGGDGSIDVPLALQRVKRAFLNSPTYGHPSVWSPWVYHGRSVTRNAQSTSRRGDGVRVERSSTDVGP